MANCESVVVGKPPGVLKSDQLKRPLGPRPDIAHTRFLALGSTGTSNVLKHFGIYVFYKSNVLQFKWQVYYYVAMSVLHWSS